MERTHKPYMILDLLTELFHPVQSMQVVSEDVLITVTSPSTFVHYVLRSTQICQCASPWSRWGTRVECPQPHPIGHSIVPYYVWPQAPARVRGSQVKCDLTFSAPGWQKIVAQIRGVFRKRNTDTPPRGQNLA